MRVPDKPGVVALIAEFGHALKQIPGRHLGRAGQNPKPLTIAPGNHRVPSLVVSPQHPITVPSREPIDNARPETSNLCAFDDQSSTDNARTRPCAAGVSSDDEPASGQRIIRTVTHTDDATCLLASSNLAIGLCAGGTAKNTAERGRGCGEHFSWPRRHGCRFCQGQESRSAHTAGCGRLLPVPRVPASASRSPNTTT